MSDIENELLALAGGDVSSDEEEAAMDMSGDESQSPAPQSKKKAGTTKGSTAAKKTPAKSSKKRAQADESEEEGEASSAPGSPDSQGSAAMEESDSDSDSPPSKGRGEDDNLNKYPVDGLFISHAEKAEIMGMREIEREQKIAERREEIERIRQNRILRQLVVNQDNKKRKAAAADLEDGQRKTSRVRTKVGGTRVGETSSGIDNLRRAREERSNRMHQREIESARRKNRSPSYNRRSGSGSDADSDVEWAKSKQRSKTPEAKKEVPLAEIRDIERVRVGRSRFAEVCFYPGFEEAITGCYVRINIGPDPITKQDVYRMALIKGFKKGAPYAMPSRTGNQFVVETYVMAAHGKAQRDWPFIACSDGAFTEAEWNRYKSVLASEGLLLPKRSALIDKIADINKLVQRPWTELEVAEKLERQNSLRIKYSGIERERLQKALDEARASGNEEKAAQLEAELEKVKVPRLAFRTSLTPVKKKADAPMYGSGDKKANMSQQERLAELNRENRRKNVQAVREAQLRERARQREIEEKLQRGEAVEQDMSKRQKTRAKFVHDHEPSEAKKNGESTTPQKAAAATPGSSTPGTPSFGAQKNQPLLPHLAKLQQQKSVDKNGIPTIHKPLMDDDIIGSLELDIDVEI